MKTFITTSAKQTQELGEMLAQELKGGEIICLEGELGSGKTTFTQGVLKGLQVEGPYTSPTFVVMKHYKRKMKRKIMEKIRIEEQNIYHVDTYRVDAKNVLKIGWEEIVDSKDNIVIVEWADKIRELIPKNSLWIKFDWNGENERKVRIISK